MFSELTLPVKRIVSEARCRWWDWQHGLTHPKLVYRILNLLKPEPGRYDFVDFGSGKGRVLLIASEFPLAQVTGVEFDQRLHAIAEENIKQFEGPRKCRQVQSLCMDAATYEPQARDTIYFFFSPFKGNVMKIVLARIRESILRDAHDCFVVYVNPELGHMIDEIGAFAPYHEDQYCRIWRALSTTLAGGTRESTVAVPITKRPSGPTS
jgi:SAM-dependent methyltransferase